MRWKIKEYACGCSPTVNGLNIKLLVSNPLWKPGVLSCQSVTEVKVCLNTSYSALAAFLRTLLL